MLWLCAAGALSACNPYPDDGEFLAGVVYAQNFMAGVKQIDRLPAWGRGRGSAAPPFYTVVATSSGGSSATPVSAPAPAMSPYWTDASKRDPLAKTSVQQVYVFDGPCKGPDPYEFDERLDLIRLDRQYPVFADIPENLTSNSGKGGRTGAYSPILEVIHVNFPETLPCQSIKRFDTAKSRIGLDLTEGKHEFRVLQIFDPALTKAPPLPTQLGFYNQLVVPYLDMGTAPLLPDGQSFVTMPLYKVTYKNSMGTKLNAVVVFGTALEPPPPGTSLPLLSPICRDFTLDLTLNMAPDPTEPLPNATGPMYAKAVATHALSSCLVCETVDMDGNLGCPFAHSEAGAR